ncbi:MAG TPA: DUF1552 domain-containing protein [Opitutales bacterium]|jgi:hypothetical protein|nr:DUF1552 domain-containing protein [Opitutales bacterium]
MRLLCGFMSNSWQLPRRKFLRGLGTVMALPLFESVMPTARLLGATTNVAKAFPTRMAFLYIPNGANMAHWTPQATGANYELPYSLAPLADFQKDFTVISQLDNNNANELGDGGGGHARASASYLTGVHPRKTAGADIKAGISVDQIAADKIGDQTKLPSLELSCDHGQRAGSCDSGYSCAYQFNISWKSDTMPMNPEVDPKLAFERLFGAADDAATKEARAKRDLYNKSVIDFVMEDAANLNKNLSGNDQRKLDEYLSAVRDLERRIESSQKYVIELSPEQRQMKVLADYNFEAHSHLMLDIMALAFQTDATRVSTFILGHDGSNRPYPQATAQGYDSGIAEGHHDLSHHRNDPEKLTKLAIINRYHMTQMAYLLGKLKAVKEGDGTLLDNCMVLYGGGLSDGNAHTPENLPVVLAGRGGNRIATGQHLHLGELTPITNLYRSMLDVMGAPTEKLGDSNGKLESIFTPTA